VAETLVHVEAIDRASGARALLDHAACELRYRDSIFKGRAADRYLVTRVRFRLAPGGAPKIAYAELAAAMKDKGPPPRRAAGEMTGPTLASVRETVIALRRAKSMVLDDRDENRRSAGSFFVNPIIALAEVAAVREAAARVAPGQAMPEYPTPGGVKLSAAWLIERAGLTRGTVRGRVGISTRHSLALVNRGGASAAELVAFAAEVRERVRDAFGVLLTPEPRLVGFTPEEVASLVG
jgi:UDP-N-acetylmuramate dehydrogenase